MRGRLRAGAAWLLILAATAGADAQETYTVKLTRPLRVGWRMQMWSEASQEMTLTIMMGGRSEQVESSKLSVTFESLATIVEVDGDGRAILVTHKVRASELIHDGIPSEIVAPGTKVTARRGHGQTIFEVDGQRVDPSVQQALELVAGLDTDGATDDELFGTKQPAQVGKEWPIDTEAVAREFQRYTSKKVRAEDVSGTGKLVDFTEQDGVPCQIIHTRLTARNALPGAGLLPPGVQLKKAKLAVHMYDLLPLDDRRPVLGEAMSMDIEVVFTGRMGERGVAMDARVAAKIEGRRDYSMLSPRLSMTTSRAR